MRLRTLVIAALAVTAVIATAVPALASWLHSTDPADSTGARLWVDSTPRVSAGGWRVTWTVQVRCPRGQRIQGYALIAERDPAAIPELAGEDQGITARRDLTAGPALRCTGLRQVLQLRLPVSDTTVFDPASGEPKTYHAPISPTPSNRTSAAIQLMSAKAPADGGFFVQYCAAPNCASESGPRVTLR